MLVSNIFSMDGSYSSDKSTRRPQNSLPVLTRKQVQFLVFSIVLGILAFSALQKTFVIFFCELPGDLALKNGGGGFR